VGKEPVSAGIADFGSRIADYCREIETYLCRKNDGHLIRVTGPSFDLVAGWARQGVPLKVACAGIDRCFERYYRKGPRRRPVKIDFCEADVLDVFDEWRRAVGIPSSLQSSVFSPQSPSPQSPTPRHSLPAHLERVVLRLSEARARGAVGAPFDTLIDRAAAELEVARAQAGGLRGKARQALIERLVTLDEDLLNAARFALDEASRAEIERIAEQELSAFRAGMTSDAFAAARERAIARLVRERFGLPSAAIS
jgi:hypothetical protein